MSPLSNILIALSMSADAFAAALAKGVALKKPELTYAMRIGLVFGVVETITPVIGWVLGTLASSAIAAIDHWLAFAILSAIGCKMIYEGLHPHAAERKETHSLKILILTAIGTSIDALAVGTTLAFLDTNIWAMALMIGGATFLMATAGVMVGHYIGTKAGKWAEIAGGLCLLAIGCMIVLEHTQALA